MRRARKAASAPARKIIEAQRRADDLHELLMNLPLGDPRWESTWAALNEAQTVRNRLEDGAVA